MTKPRTNPEPGEPHVYFLEAGGYIKIGITNDLPYRIKLLQTGCPFPITARLLIEHGGRDLERRLHLKFDHLRTRPTGEWYRPGEDLLEFIEKIEQADVFDPDLVGPTPKIETMIYRVDPDGTRTPVGLTVMSAE